MLFNTAAPLFALLLPVVAANAATDAPRRAAAAPSACEIGFRGPQFLAISVNDVEASTNWYASVFGVSVLKDLPSSDSSVHTRVLSSDDLLIELSEHSRARSLQSYAGAPAPTYLVHGFFKAGFFVENLDHAVEVLKARGVTSFGSTQGDPPTGLRWVLFRDNGGHFLQLFERGAAKP
jgi:catechol 2,3-dioxygenase-like lactoylglutathione lyase family enzyme